MAPAHWRGARAGLAPGPWPAHRPRPPAAGEAAALGAGTRRAARSAEPELDAAAAATATCAAVIKVGRPRAAAAPYRSAPCVRSAPPAAAPGEGCWGSARRGDPAGRGGPGLQPLRVTLHKALLLSRPQFPHRESGRGGGPFLSGLLGGAAPSSRLPTSRDPDGHCLHSPPAVRAAHPGCGKQVPTGLLGRGGRGRVCALREPCCDFPPLSWVTCWAGTGNGKLGTPPGPCRAGLGVQDGAVRLCPPSLPRGLGLRELLFGGGGPLSADLCGPDPCRQPGFRERYGMASCPSLPGRLLAPSSVFQPGGMQLAHIRVWTPERLQCPESRVCVRLGLRQSACLMDCGSRLSG